MKAGLAREKITPPEGTPMIGAARRDREGGSRSVHDDLYVRMLYLSQAGSAVLVASYDLCFLGRDDVDRLKRVLKRVLGAETGLGPERILLATTHTHAGPALGTWAFAGYAPPNTAYLAQVESATLRAAAKAAAGARPVTVRAGCGRTRVPMNRRRPLGDGTVVFGPHPGGVICDRLPVMSFADAGNRLVALVFAASCHPSVASGHEISADFPGAACAALDRRFGPAVSLFLQGAGGDAKPASSAMPDVNPSPLRERSGRRPG